MQLEFTDAYIQQEVEMVQGYLDLLEQPGAFYEVSSDAVQRKLLAA